MTHTRPHVLLAMLVVLSGCIALLHFAALKDFYYWRLWWFDVLMHFLGGVLIGTASIWLLSRFGTHYSSILTYIYIALFAAFVVGVLWELFEGAIGLFHYEEFFPDTLYDLFMDSSGGIISGLICGFFVRKQKIIP